MTHDPTSVHVDAAYDPLTQRMEGTAIHGNTPFSVPYISHVVGNLYQGGCANGLVLPTNIEYVVSLYPWEQYVTHDGVVSVMSVKLYDADLADPKLLITAARTVRSFMHLGPTLVHCQAGLNRSSLVAALALMIKGMSANDAIGLLRDKRSPAVLCNPVFETWLRNEATAELWRRF